MNWSFLAIKELDTLPHYARHLAFKKIEKRKKKQNLENVYKSDVLKIKEDEKIRELVNLEKRLNSIDYIQNLDINICGGIRGCKFSHIKDLKVLELIYEKIAETKILEIIEEYKSVKGTKHNKLKLALSSCPNSCSQPQIQDISIQGYKEVYLDKEKCINCGLCREKCPLKAISLEKTPIIDYDICLGCGICSAVCPIDALKIGKIKYRIYIGGRLGKSPRLAVLHSESDNLEELEKRLVEAMEDFIKALKTGERLSDLV